MRNHVIKEDHSTGFNRTSDEVYVRVNSYRNMKECFKVSDFVADQETKLDSNVHGFAGVLVCLPAFQYHFVT